MEEIELQEIEIERKHVEDAERLAEAHAQRQQVEIRLLSADQSLSVASRSSLTLRLRHGSVWSVCGSSMQQRRMRARCSGSTFTGSGWWDAAGECAFS